MEESIRVEESIKSPDYSFRLGRKLKFFVETKKPSINIQGSIYPTFQLRRYAWSASLSLSILTDFEEFAVYDCRAEPKKSTSREKAGCFTCSTISMWSGGMRSPHSFPKRRCWQDL